MNEVWRAYTSNVEINAIESEIDPILSDSERARLEKIKQADRRNQYLISRAMIRAALSGFYALPLSCWHLTENKDAAPCITNAPDKALYISLSHSADCILLAISQQPVGIDVEKMGAVRPYLEIAKRVFTPAQQAGLKALPSEQIKQHFYNLWTHKEALVKLVDKPQTVQMFSNNSWETDRYNSAHTEFTGFYASLLATHDIAQFDSYEFQSLDQIDKTSIF